MKRRSDKMAKPYDPARKQFRADAAQQMPATVSNAPSSARRVPEKSGTKIIRAAGAAVAKKYEADNAPRAPQRVSGRQDWRRG
jgi:hypothetical protein